MQDEKGVAPSRFPASRNRRCPPVVEPRASDVALARALALVRDLRARCPWDGAQTRATLRPYLVEEVLELEAALNDGDPLELRDELGDLLLHLAFQLVIGRGARRSVPERGSGRREGKMGGRIRISLPKPNGRATGKGKGTRRG